MAIVVNIVKINNNLLLSDNISFFIINYLNIQYVSYIQKIVKLLKFTKTKNKGYFSNISYIRGDVDNDTSMNEITLSSISLNQNFY